MALREGKAEEHEVHDRVDRSVGKGHQGVLLNVRQDKGEWHGRIEGRRRQERSG